MLPQRFYIGLGFQFPACVRYWSYLLLLCGLFLTGCHSRQLSPTAYETYLSNPDHGLMQSRDVIHKIRIAVQYLPVPYLTYKEMKKTGLPLTLPSYDSLKTAYQEGATFQLTLESLDPKLDLEGLLYGKATEVAEKSAIMATMDTELVNQLTLEVAGKSYHPALCIRESMPGMNRKVHFLMVFPVDIPKAADEKLTFVLDDSFFQTGRTTLYFQAKDLTTAPDIQW